MDVLCIFCVFLVVKWFLGSDMRYSVTDVSQKGSNFKKNLGPSWLGADFAGAEFVRGRVC